MTKDELVNSGRQQSVVILASSLHTLEQVALFYRKD